MDPPIGPLALERLLFLIEQDLGKFTPTPPTQKNISRSEKEALAELKAMSDIIIKPADKGSAVVVLNKQDYIEEGMRQLSDTKFYKKLDYDPTETFNDKIKEVVEQLYRDGEISEGLKRYLVVDTPRTPQLYLLLKIHKGKFPPPGRPIESVCSSPTERISQLCDIELRPLVLLMLSYIKDTTHFLNRLGSLGPQPPGTILVVLDVEALYPSIPIEDGLLQAGKRIHKYRDQYKKPSTSALIKLMRLVLEKNNFQFNGVNYLQIAGTAMGTRMAPQFANLYMAQFEEEHVYTYKPGLEKFWFRFIDDVFLLWHHGEDELQKFISHLSTCHKPKTIKFSHEYSREGVPFLDTWVYLDSDGNLNTKVYTKPTDSHNYLHYTSAHPRKCIEAIPYGQFIRIKRICFKTSDFEEHAKLLSHHFKRRGYPDSLIQSSLEKVCALDRSTLLAPKKKQARDKDKVFFTTTYNPANPNLRKSILDNWPLLADNPSSRATLLPKKVIFGFRRPPNLKNELVRTKIPKNKSLGKVLPGTSNPCNRVGKCTICPIIDKSGKITSHSTGIQYHTKIHVSCKSSNLIYVMSCF